MSITVTADLDAGAPRLEVTVATPAGQTMTAVTLTRTAAGLTQQTRVQPAAGFASVYVEDYEAPWWTDVVYAATVTYGATTETYTAAPVQLQPDAAWAVHPTVPGLSVCVDRRDADRIGFVTVGAVSRPATSVQHAVIGAKYPVTVRSGPRASSRVQVVVAAVTEEDEDALWALVDDQTPLLWRVPPAWGLHWEDGYYDVGDANADRVVQVGDDTRRAFTFALTRVEAPAGAQAPTWSYSDVLAEFPDYPALAVAFADYPSLLGNNRT